MNEEKKEFIKREEIRTMQKDVARLREEEARKERERIAALKTEEEARKREEAKRLVEAERRKEIEEQEEEKKIMEEIRKRARELEKLKPPPEKPVLIKKPSFFEKIFVRIVVIIILLLVFALLFTFCYWYFQVRKVPALIPEKPPVEEVILPAEEIPEILIPPSLILVEETKTLEISEIIQIPDLISQALKEELRKEVLTRILIKNIPENRWVTFGEFLEAFQIKTPKNFYQKLKENYTLFIYSQEQGKRVGFMVKVSEKNLSELLKSWESSMEKDFENLFLLMQKEKPALVPYFKDASYQKTSFRYQTFSREDLGICYSIFDDYFIFTSSWESMKKIIDQLKM